MWMPVYIILIGTIHWFAKISRARCQGISFSWFHLLHSPITFLFCSGCLEKLPIHQLKDSLHHAAKCFSACANIGLKRSATCITSESNAWRVSQGSAPSVNFSQRFPHGALLTLAPQTDPIKHIWNTNSTRSIEKYQEMKIESVKGFALHMSEICGLDQIEATQTLYFWKA